MGRLENGLSMRFLMELEMGPFPIELQIENRAVSLQPCGARDGTRTHDLLITNYDLFFSCNSIKFNKRLYHAVF